MTPPLRSPDVAPPANSLEPGLSRYAIAFVVGSCYFAEVIALPILEALASLFAVFGGMFFTFIAMFVVSAASSPLRRNDKLRRWWQNHAWASPALIGVVAMLLVVAWLPPLRRRIQEPDFSDHVVETFNFEVGVVGWLLLLFAIINYTSPEVPSPAPSHSPDGPTCIEEAS